LEGVAAPYPPQSLYGAYVAVRAYCESRLRAENDEQTTGSQTLVVAGDICAKPKPATSDELIAAMREYRKYKAWTVDAAKTADSRYHMACETQRGSDNSRLLSEPR
jgi:hypothetical protein